MAMWRRTVPAGRPGVKGMEVEGDVRKEEEEEREAGLKAEDDDNNAGGDKEDSG